MSLKKIIFFIFLLCSIFSFAQVENPVNFKVNVSKNEAKIGETIEISFEATIEKGWYVYGTGKYESAPSSVFSFEKNKTIELVGDLILPKYKHKNDEYIGEYDYVTEKAIFKQKVKILAANPIIKGIYEYSTCSQESGICLPPKETDFSVEVKVIEGKNEKGKTKSEILSKNIDTVEIIVPQKIVDSTINKAEIKPIITQKSETENASLWGFFVLAFLSGLAALITPCVFPMIPMTVTFFLNASKSKRDGRIKALVYAVSIVLIYSTLGVLVAFLAGAEATNFISTHWLPNLFFFGVFVIFALSFLGLFEITLPSSVVNAIDKKSEKGGFTGVFFMAFTLCLVSFSCTGPIVGNVLVLASKGDFLKPIVGMLGFSLAFAIPFTLFALFPSWLKNLPKSGGWLNSVKVVLGFLELALALKFLSLADQAYHWNILPRDINISLWIAIFTLIGMYLLHKIKLPHDDEDYLTQKISVFKIIIAIFSFSFVVYLVPGLFGAPLKPLSGYLPPQKNTDFGLKTSSLIDESNSNNLCEKPKYADFLELPHGLKGYFDYNQALECSRKTGKPIFIDFTGHGCTNCREMEANVWSEPEVLKKLQNDFIILALYVDDKTELPENQWYTSKIDNKIKKTIGKQNADLQISKFNTNAQPYYVIIDADENVLNEPTAYNKDISAFLAFLNAGRQLKIL